MKRKKKRRRSQKGAHAASKSGKPAFASLDFTPRGESTELDSRAQSIDAKYFSAMAECAALGTCNRRFRWAVPVLPFRGFEATGELWRCWDHFGEILTASCRGQSRRFSLPSAQEVIELLEKRRRQWLYNIRILLPGFETFLDAFIGEGFFAAHTAERVYPAHIVTCNHLLIYLRARYQLFPHPSIGWKRGRCAEMDTLRLQLPSRSEWCPQAIEFFSHFPLELEDLGGFVLPGQGSKSKDAQGETRVAARAAYSPERILFSMSLSAYGEMRALSGKNRYGYMAIVYGKDPESGLDRVGLDTIAIGHRFLGFVGTLEQIIGLAQSSNMTELRSSPLCQIAPIHDPGGNWRNVVRDWLRC